MLNPILTQYHLQNRYFDIFNGCTALNAKRLYIEKILYFTEELINIIPSCCLINKQLALFCAEHYMDGYVNQFELLGELDDTKVSHFCLGVDRFDKWLTHSSYVAPINTEIQIFKDVLLYYKVPELCTMKDSKPYVRFINAVDSFVSAANYLQYIPRIIEADSKGYIRKDSKLNQRFVSPYVFNHYESGKKFNKPECLTTYAEYTLFAATLMTNIIKKYPFLRKLLLRPGYGYATVLEGYNSIFKETLSVRTSKKASLVLKHYIE